MAVGKQLVGSLPPPSGLDDDDNKFDYLYLIFSKNQANALKTSPKILLNK